MTKKQIRKATPTGVREVLPNGDIRNPTPADHLKILEVQFERTAKALKAKREELGLQSAHAEKEQREAFVDAFTLGDDLDDERALRSAGILLEWSFGDGGIGNAEVKHSLARGLGAALALVADSIAMDRRRVHRVADKLRLQGTQEMNFLADDLREK